MKNEITIKVLRGVSPEWAWTAVHRGFGYEYIGTRDGERIRVHAVAMHCGPAEDDYSTEWRVDDGAKSKSFTSWWLTNY